MPPGYSITPVPAATGSPTLRCRILTTATPTATLFDVIRNQSRHNLKRLERHLSLQDDEAPSEAELAVMEQLRRTLELSVLIVDNFLDE